MERLKCKICRRLGVSVCGREDCALKTRPSSPGQKGKRRLSRLSEYGKQLKEKQKLKNLYCLRERQFKRYIKEVLEKKSRVEDASNLLMKKLESRLDNVIFRLGFAKSRPQARQLVSHGHFLVNGESLNIPSYQVKKGDVVSLKPQKRKKIIFQNLQNMLKKHKTQSWLELNPEKLEGKIIGEPNIQEISPPVEISMIFEYYSK